MTRKSRQINWQINKEKKCLKLSENLQGNLGNQDPEEREAMRGRPGIWGCFFPWGDCWFARDNWVVKNFGTFIGPGGQSLDFSAL